MKKVFFPFVFLLLAFSAVIAFACIDVEEVSASTIDFTPYAPASYVAEPLHITELGHYEVPSFVRSIRISGSAVGSNINIELPIGGYTISTEPTFSIFHFFPSFLSDTQFVSFVVYGGGFVTSLDVYIEFYSDTVFSSEEVFPVAEGVEFVHVSGFLTGANPSLSVFDFANNLICTYGGFDLVGDKYLVDLVIPTADLTYNGYLSQGFILADADFISLSYTSYYQDTIFSDYYSPQFTIPFSPQLTEDYLNLHNLGAFSTDISRLYFAVAFYGEVFGNVSITKNYGTGNEEILLFNSFSVGVSPMFSDLVFYSVDVDFSTNFKFEVEGGAMSLFLLGFDEVSPLAPQFATDYYLYTPLDNVENFELTFDSTLFPSDVCTLYFDIEHFSVRVVVIKNYGLDNIILYSLTGWIAEGSRSKRLVVDFLADDTITFIFSPAGPPVASHSVNLVGYDTISGDSFPFVPPAPPVEDLPLTIIPVDFKKEYIFADFVSGEMVFYDDFAVPQGVGGLQFYLISVDCSAVFDIYINDILFNNYSFDVDKTGFSVPVVDGDVVSIDWHSGSQSALWIMDYNVVFEPVPPVPPAVDSPSSGSFNVFFDGLWTNIISFFNSLSLLDIGFGSMGLLIAVILVIFIVWLIRRKR